jgi:sigma-E factor negative regulatory protein RseB
VRSCARVLPALAIIALAGMVTHGAPTSVAQQTAPVGLELLRRARQAEVVHSYRGVRVTRTFLPGSAMTATAHVLHRRPATTRTEYLSPPALAGTVVLQIGSDRWHRSSSDQRWRHAPAAPEFDSLDLLERNYDLRVGAGSLVANRECQLLFISPKHDGNPSKRMWLDRDTGLILRSELLNWRQDDISVSSFERLEVDPPFSADETRSLLPPRAVESPDRGALAFKPLFPRYVPAGYVFTGLTVVPLHGERAAHLRYSDGLNTISLFQAPAAAFALRSPRRSRELSYAVVFTWQRGPMSYALMGDIRPTELQRMAASVQPPSPASRR